MDYPRYLILIVLKYIVKVKLLLFVMLLVLAVDGDPNAWLSELLKGKEWLKIAIRELERVALR